MKTFSNLRSVFGLKISRTNYSLKQQFIAYYQLALKTITFTLNANYYESIKNSSLFKKLKSSVF